jgi:hypothetical protein
MLAARKDVLMTLRMSREDANCICLE